jgi:hypothetical protein
MRRKRELPIKKVSCKAPSTERRGKSVNGSYILVSHWQSQIGISKDKDRTLRHHSEIEVHVA